MGAFLKLKWFIQLIIVLVVAGIGFGAAFYFLMQPVTVTIADQRKRLSEVEGKITAAKERKAKLDQFKKESDAQEGLLAESKKILPPEKENKQLLIDVVQSAAARSNLKIQQLSSKPTVDHEIYTEWPLDMEVTGTYHNVANFLQRMYELDRIFNIGKMRLKTRSADGEASFIASVGANYEVTTYFSREAPIEEAPAKGAKGKAKGK